MAVGQVNGSEWRRVRPDVPLAFIERALGGKQPRTHLVVRYLRTTRVRALDGKVSNYSTHCSLEKHQKDARASKHRAERSHLGGRGLQQQARRARHAPRSGARRRNARRHGRLWLGSALKAHTPRREAASAVLRPPHRRPSGLARRPKVCCKCEQGRRKRRSSDPPPALPPQMQRFAAAACVKCIFFCSGFGSLGGGSVGQKAISRTQNSISGSGGRGWRFGGGGSGGCFTEEGGAESCEVVFAARHEFNGQWAARRRHCGGRRGRWADDARRRTWARH